MRRVTSFVAIVLGLAVPASAQSFRPPDPLARPWAKAQLNLGPIYFAPTFELKDVGIESNVFNDDANPKSDLTGKLGLRSLIGVHFGEGLVFQVSQSNYYVYFRRYASERSIEADLGLTLEYRTRAFRPWIRWNRVKSAQRTGVEVDARAERKVPTFDLGADFTGTFRLGVSGAARRTRLQYADTEMYEGVNLAQTLNGQSDAVQGYLRYAMTDLSDFIVGTDYLRDRFYESTKRDNDSYYYYAGVQTKEGATFVGSATAGMRTQKHKDPTVPNFQGFIANIGVGVVPSEYLRIDLNGARDIGYSYQEKYPYFVEESAGATVTNRFAERMDLVLAARATWLRYNETIDGLKDPYTDRTVVLGIGTGFFLGGGTGARIGILFERWARVSPIADRNYVSNRISSSYRLSF